LSLFLLSAGAEGLLEVSSRPNSTECGSDAWLGGDACLCALREPRAGLRAACGEHNGVRLEVAHKSDTATWHGGQQQRSPNLLHYKYAQEHVAASYKTA
jgi:hypothetical protein